MSPFFRHFEKVYGSRWEGLRAALLKESDKVTRNCFQGHATYVLDSASILAAESLEVKPGDQVLDLCAAPGGKSLILLEALQGKGFLVANEWSQARRLRLKDVIQSHVPAPFRNHVEVTGFDGNLFGLKRPNAFDRVLLDAPCSSERHLLQEDPEQVEWKVSRTKQLAMRQYSLLCSALLTLKPGGTVLYSTCSISPLENDGVIGRLLERKSESVQIDPDDRWKGDLEQTEFGVQIFPDRAHGSGPMYFSRLIKTR